MTNIFSGLVITIDPLNLCAFCGNKGKGMIRQPETGKFFHFDCWIKNIVDERIDERLKDLKIK